MDTIIYDDIINRLTTVSALNSNQTLDIKTENSSKCLVADYVDDYAIKAVQAGEVCTIETAKKYGIFGKTNYFNSIVPKDERDKIDTFIDNQVKGLSYSLCTNNASNTSFYENCVLSTKNPWKTLSDNKEFCTLPKGISLPSGLSVTALGVIEKPPVIPFFVNKSELCNDRWYDWFTIPDWHLGNRYFKADGASGSCYKPCEINTMPAKSDDGNLFDRCIPKKYYQFGFYANSFNYLPIALIVLLGSTKSTIIKYNEYHTLKLIETIDGSRPNFDLYQSIKEDVSTQENLYNNIKGDLNIAINTLFKIPFNMNNIIIPEKHIQDRVQYDMTKDKVVHAYEIALHYYNLITAVDLATIKQFTEWKQELQNISGFDISSNEMIKQLLILKKACSVAFDGTSSYSKNLLDIMNKNLLSGEGLKKPLKFTFTDNDASISSKTTELSQNGATQQSAGTNAPPQNALSVYTDEQKKKSMETMAKLIKGGFNMDYLKLLAERKQIYENSSLTQKEKDEKIQEKDKAFDAAQRQITDPSKFSEQDKEDLRLFFELFLNGDEFGRIMNMLRKEDKIIINQYHIDIKLELNGEIELNAIDDAIMKAYNKEIAPHEYETPRKTLNKSYEVLYYIGLIFVLLFTLYIIFTIASVFWTPFIWVINQIFNGFLFIILIIPDMISRGAMAPSHIQISLIESDIIFLKSKIWFDRVIRRIG
jgi:hypothetical protein